MNQSAEQERLITLIKMLDGTFGDKVPFGSFSPHAGARHQPHNARELRRKRKKAERQARKRNRA